MSGDPGQGSDGPRPDTSSRGPGALRWDVLDAVISGVIATAGSLAAAALPLGDADQARAMWPLYFFIVFLPSTPFHGRPSPLRRLSGKEEVREFTKAYRSGRAPQGVDRALWLDVLDEVGTRALHRRRVRIVLTILAASVVLTAVGGVAALVSERIPWLPLGAPLWLSVVLCIVLGVDHVIMRAYRGADLRRELEETP